MIDLKYVLPELNALTGLALFETFVVLGCTVDDTGFLVKRDCVGRRMVVVENWGCTEEVMDVKLEFAFDVVE